jgi:transcriptional regulator with XRE-family HTH domain
MTSDKPKPPVSDAAVEFGARVRARRKEMGLSLKALTEDAEVHWTWISHIERGQRNLSLTNILKLADLLQIDPAVLVQGLRNDPESDAGKLHSGNSAQK